jgi:hypothetical protein
MERWLHLSSFNDGDGLHDRENRAADIIAVPISEALRERLMRWSGMVLYRPNPIGLSHEEYEAINAPLDAEGLAIARALKAELPDWTIYYYDHEAAAEANYEGDVAEIGVLIEGP